MDNETPASTEQESTKAKVKQKKEKKTKAPKSKTKGAVVPVQESEKAQEPEQEEPDRPIPTPYDMYKDLLWLRQVVFQHSQQIAELQARPARKRALTRSGKVQVRDKETGTVYPSKNNTYQSLLKAGELKDLVDAGIFGAEPEKNNFGWFALVRALPDRFEEVKAEETVSQ